jgi:predicted membrane protein
MRDLLSDALHIFIIFMIAAFVIGGILAITGTFDHWGSRYILKRRRKRLLRNRRTDIRDNKQQQVNTAPYYSTDPDRAVIGQKSKYP